MPLFILCEKKTRKLQKINTKKKRKKENHSNDNTKTPQNHQLLTSLIIELYNKNKNNGRQRGK